MELGLPLILVAVALFIVGLVLRRVRPDKEAVLKGEEVPARPSMFGGRRASKAVIEPEASFAPPRPAVSDFSIEDGIAKVTFDVPMAGEADEVLRDVLLSEAVEVVRERRHTAGANFTDIAVYAGNPVREIVSRTFPDGVLPEQSGPSLLNLSAIAMDPLEVLVSSGPKDLDLPSRTSGDKVGPIGREIRVPKAVDTGLRAQGIDPATMTAAQLITGMLSLVGYQVTPGVADNTWFAQKGGERTFIREDPLTEDGYPEVEDGAIQRFLFEFQSAGTDRGLFVSDKYAPFGIYEKEAREPRIRFLTRERLQKFVDGLAL
ncbi:MAG TPA: hypothetical protein VLB67_00685 [Acidimicrobiia bacterium]|nr:hypothetical protein [Acidimicrobiia bacterium]